MRIRALSYALLAVALLAFSACKSLKHPKTKKLAGTWQATPIIIDGKNTDWRLPYPDYDEKAGLGYEVTNDKDYLYITVETGDIGTQVKLLRNGLTVWIDRKGEQNEATAINYPLPNTNKEDMEEHNRKHLNRQEAEGQEAFVRRMRIDLEDGVKKAASEAKEFSLQGFKACNLQYPVDAPDSCGILVHIGIDEDHELIWEARIPFKAFYFKPELAKSDKGRPVSICIETTGSQRVYSPHGAGGPPGGSQDAPAAPRVSGGVGVGVGGMNLGIGSGGRNGGPPPQNNIMENQYKSSKTWKTFGLAWPE